MIELNDVLEVLEVPQELWVGKLGLEGIGHPGAKESRSEARNLHCPPSTYSVHMPADHTIVTQLNVIREWASNLGHSSWDPD